MISSTIVVPRTLQATLMRRWRSSVRSKVRRFGFAGFTGGGEITFVAGVRSLTHSSPVVGRIGLLGNGAVFFAIKRDEFFGEGSYFLGCQGLRVGFTHDQTAQSALGETDSLVNVRSQDGHGITVESFLDIPADSGVYDFTINRKYRFQ